MTVKQWDQETINFLFNKQHPVLERNIISVKFVLYTSLCSKCTLKEPRSLHKRIFCVNLEREYFLCEMLLNYGQYYALATTWFWRTRSLWKCIAEVILLKQKMPGLLLIRTCCLHDCPSCLSGKGPCFKELVVGTKKRKMLEPKGCR